LKYPEFKNPNSKTFLKRGEKNLRFLTTAIAIHIKIWYNDSAIKKVGYNFIEYACLVQDLKGKKKILSQVIAEFCKIPGIKILSGKLHGGYFRKILISNGKVWENFFLIRIHLEFKIGSKMYKWTPTIYPSDVYPYGRQTLNVVEKAAESRYKERKSWKSLEDELYQRYGFSLNRIKRMISRVSLAFERLMTSRTIQRFIDVVAWIRDKVESFESLSFSYAQQMLSGLFCREVFKGDLFSP
jgi:hypothetical protein